MTPTADTIQAASAGDPHARAELARWVQPRVTRHLAHRIGRYKAAVDHEDIAQEVLVVLLTTTTGAWRSPEDVLRWTYAVCNHKAADAFRVAGRAPRTEPIDALSVLPDTDPDTDPEHHLIATEETRELHHMLATLPERNQRLLWLHIGLQQTSQSVAAELGTTPGYVRVAAHRLLLALRPADADPTARRHHHTAPCGSESGWHRHRDRNEPACDPCCNAFRAAQRRRGQRKRAARKAAGS